MISLCSWVYPSLIHFLHKEIFKVIGGLVSSDPPRPALNKNWISSLWSSAPLPMMMEGARLHKLFTITCNSKTSTRSVNEKHWKCNIKIIERKGSLTWERRKEPMMSLLLSEKRIYGTLTVYSNCRLIGSSKCWIEYVLEDTC